MLRILIVDDDEKIRETLTLGLTMNGFEVLAAESAEQAWLLIKQNHFDIIILDYVMPVQSGIELCTLIRQQEQYQDTVIIMLTAKDTDADFLLTKPSAGGGLFFWEMGNGKWDDLPIRA